MEVKAADRQALAKVLKASYGHRGNTLLWAIAVFCLSSVVLIPITGQTLGLLFALMTSSIWTAVHHVKRI